MITAYDPRTRDKTHLSATAADECREWLPALLHDARDEGCVVISPDTLTERVRDDSASGTDPGTPGVRLRGTAVQAPDTTRSVSVSDRPEAAA